MNASLPDTSKNPGSFQKRKLPTIKGFILSNVNFLVALKLKTSLYYTIGHTVNYFNKYLPFLSKKFYCPCCESILPYFIHLSNYKGISWHSACPSCDSRSRHRGLTQLIPHLKKLLPIQPKIIHFAPETVLFNSISSLNSNSYQTSDFFLKDVDFSGENLESLSFKNASFDLAICNHILEHLKKDGQAISELSRILTNSGILILTVPGDFTQKKTIEHKNTDSNGHYRHYGKAIIKKLEEHFYKIDSIDLHYFNNLNKQIIAIKKNDFVFICYKSKQKYNLL